MPPKLCCCQLGCELGSDDFNRADANPPTGNWKELTGDWSITGNTVQSNGGPGKLATTICHPAVYDHGSWRAYMTLVDVRTIAKFTVGAGDPNTSTIKVEFEGINMDTVNAKIRVTVYGDTTESFDYPWVGSANRVNVWVCYMPTVALKGFVLGAGIPVDACLAGDGDPCYSFGGVAIGGFFFIEGRFDDWAYEVTNIDNIECPACGCLCLKPISLLNPDIACFPTDLVASFRSVGSSTDCIVPDFDVPLTKLLTASVQWVSGPITTCGWTWELKANCTSETQDDGSVWYMMSLQITHLNANPQFFIFWTNVDATRGETATIKFPIYASSTCNPLSLVYRYATLYTTGTSGGVGTWTNICCPFFTGSTDILWEVTITL